MEEPSNIKNIETCKKNLIDTYNSIRKLRANVISQNESKELFCFDDIFAKMSRAKPLQNNSKEPTKIIPLQVLFSLNRGNKQAVYSQLKQMEPEARQRIMQEALQKYIQAQCRKTRTSQACVIMTDADIEHNIIPKKTQEVVREYLRKFGEVYNRPILFVFKDVKGKCNVSNLQMSRTKLRAGYTLFKLDDMELTLAPDWFSCEKNLELSTLLTILAEAKVEKNKIEAFKAASGIAEDPIDLLKDYFSNKIFTKPQEIAIKKALRQKWMQKQLRNPQESAIQICSEEDISEKMPSVVRKEARKAFNRYKDPTIVLFYDSNKRKLRLED